MNIERVTPVENLRTHTPTHFLYPAFTNLHCVAPAFPLLHSVPIFFCY